MADAVVGCDRPQRFAGGVSCADVASSRALILGAAGTPPSLPVKVAKLGEPPSWRPLSAAAGNLPLPWQPSIATRQRPTLTTKRPAPPPPAPPPQAASFTRHRM